MQPLKTKIYIFLSQFLEMHAGKRESVKRLYVGGMPRRVHEIELRINLLKENPDLESKELYELFRDKLKSEDVPKYLKLTERSQNYSDGKFCNSLTKDDENSYDFVFIDQVPVFRPRPGPNDQMLQLPSPYRYSITSKKYEFDGKKYYFPQPKAELLFDAAESLNETGYLIFCSKMPYKKGELNLGLDEISEGILNNHGFYINAIFQEKSSDRGRPDTIAIISRNNLNNLIFVADLSFADKFEIKYLSKPNKKDQGLVSYFESTVPKKIIKKMKEADFDVFEDKDKKNSPRIYNGDVRITKINCQSLSIKKSLQKVSEYIDMCLSTHVVFLYVQILSDNETKDKDALLKKSQILNYLKQSPRVLAYHSCPEDLGGTGAIFIYINLRYTEQFISNFLSVRDAHDQERNLTYGYFMNREDFFGLDQIRSEDDAQKSIFFNYEGYKEYLLKDLVGVNEEDKDLFDEITYELREDGSDKKGRILAILRRVHRWEDESKIKIAICIDEPEDIYLLSQNTSEYDYLMFYVDDRTKARYLETFLNSEVGRQLYYSNLKLKGQKRALSAKEICNIKIFLPKNEDLLPTVKSHDKIRNLQGHVNQIHNSFSVNPKATIIGRMDQIDNMLFVAEKLNKQDQIHKIIRDSERGDAEFKASWKLPTDDINEEEEPERFAGTSIRTQAVVIKVMNSFINTRGGNLIIGVEDENNTIIGLEPELKHFYSKQFKTLTKQKDEFDRQFGIALKTFFELRFIGKENNISSEFVEMENGALVYHVSCTPSYYPCHIKQVQKGYGKKINEALNGKDFFVRKKSESLPLDGVERGEYMYERASLERGEE